MTTNNIELEISAEEEGMTKNTTRPNLGRVVVDLSGDLPRGVMDDRFELRDREVEELISVFMDEDPWKGLGPGRPEKLVVVGYHGEADLVADAPCGAWQPIANLETAPDDEFVLIVDANRRGQGGVLQPVPMVWRVSVAREAIARAERTPRHLRLTATHFARFAGFPAQTSAKMEMSDA